MRGKIKSLKKGFGFIEKCVAHSNDIFFHFSEFKGNASSLREGDVVTFDLEPSKKGMNAINIRLESSVSTVAIPKSLGSHERAAAIHWDREVNSDTAYYLPKDTSVLISSAKINNIENVALKTQKYIRRYADAKNFKVDAEEKYSPAEIDVLSYLVKSQYDILERYSYNHCVTAELGSRMVVGLGGASVFETGITLHHVYGFPYIPGSSLKGCLRSYIIRDFFALSEDENQDNLNKPEKEKLTSEKKALADCDFKKAFGTQDNAGEIIFLDAYPKKCEKLELEIMNPHYGDYYSGKTAAPTDNQKPNPIKFYAVPEKTEFIFRLASNRQNLKQLAICGKSLPDLLSKMLCEIGIGAKTSAGYGWFNSGDL
ncbi:MAG: type III-B CRISPR module RAMP protein Cmr6 [Treponema sp.]|nr:type III-B CRISPR module RAMP protein Cmr6 [Treponema sp.]